MPFFVRITPRSARERLDGALYAFELSEEELVERVVGPYDRGERITLSGRSLPTSDITQIDITEVETAVGGHPLVQLRAEWTSGNRRAIGNWIAENAPDVTDRYITGPPGSKAPRTGGDELADDTAKPRASPEQRPGSAEGSQLPRPLTAAVGALAVVGVVIAIISSHAWVAGGAVACVLAVAVLHRHVWRWPPAVGAVAIVVAATIAGGAAGWGIARALSSNARHSTTSSPTPSRAAPPGIGYAETAGGPAKTWSNYVDAGGREGPTIQAHQTVKVSCRVKGLRVPDGDTWWYRITSPPWNDRFYVTADAFYNNGQTSGSLRGSKFVDGHVTAC